MSSTTLTKESWDDTTGYELYVGRWSRLISRDFLQWLTPPAGLTWLEIGCGTGALTSAILERCSPAHIAAIDKSESYVAQAKKDLVQKNVTFLQGDVKSIQTNEKFDIITSGLVLNFLPDLTEFLFGLTEKLKPGGQLSAFVWDYSGHYQPMRHFWDAAREIDPTASKYDAGIKFQICNEDKLINLFQSLGLTDVAFTNLERIASFKTFDDYWLPIATAQGSVTEFISTLSGQQKEQLKQILQKRLPIALNGEIKLIINALAIKGTHITG